ncbi:bifunctional phosphopantothenoylcysteine decarboxylase/phosphopantothenate--cysteine ligase CoaBC [Ruminiclostridium cellobioparum]|uniref:Phosphopantothenoylcysteine synthetase/decarboxylase n=1 Tax=Ruminiclostridium cellobioparum subsp. termitidis CT1112 TaxID=1195236 RepID=S0FGU9_RUMCE|nr:bifunctional phosphopantothenoylcysteine decarboxylase/phosphopantothenate--cysteine ligase CoaBC [Ruminiclostridium cellobioparum]EMS68996.1 Phosphopantothenoylcysteine synthetase/decarboxylase [Ruminiclostridium cellobioparum subsp. termitidis CT1112]
MKNIILGVTGSVAAYKAADIANNLTKKGYNVEVIMTGSAREFITPLTFQSLTKNKVYYDMFEEITPKDIKHISLARKADLCLIAPASANIIGKLANGIADDMLSTVVMAMNNVPVYICPAMNTNMYINPIVQRNIKTLAEFGYHFIEPRESVLACGDLGTGALADVDKIVNTVEAHQWRA